MPRFHVFLAAVGLAMLSACAVSPAETSASSSLVAPSLSTGSAEWGPGDYCTETYGIYPDNVRAIYSLGVENYKNNDYCAAYPYLKWLLATDPLFTGEDPDDRNFLRMAGVYEQFAQQADSSERRVWLDSSLAIRQEGREAMDAAGIEYESYFRDLVEGFFYYSNAAEYEDAEHLQFDAFNRAFSAQPDSVGDWYLGQLLIGSAIEYGNKLPSPERADYVERLATYVDDPASREGFIATAEYFRAEREARIAEAVSDDAIIELVDAFENGTATCEQIRSLLSVVLSDPDRITAAGADPDALQSALVLDRCISDQLDNPRTLLALAFQTFAAGDAAEGERLFNRALTHAPSNAARADYLYLRGAKGYGDRDELVQRALRYDPAHGQSRFYQLRAVASRVGTQNSLEGRFNYWCLADQFRQLAASTGDADIASRSRETAASYERSAPTREEAFFDGKGPGDTVACSITGGTTRVR
ncbi:MAG: hypothetical protein Rubg2KO_19590 [Rubricoccaceae bacterium]